MRERRGSSATLRMEERDGVWIRKLGAVVDLGEPESDAAVVLICGVCSPV
jgi:hypothetical protein